MAGEGVSIRQAEANIRAERAEYVKCFAYELISMQDISKVQLTQEQKLDMKGKRAPSAKSMERCLQKSISLADIRSRHPEPSSGEPFSSKEFAYARECYRDDEVFPKEPYPTSKKMYGSCKNLLQMAKEAVSKYEIVASINVALVNIMREEKVFGIPVVVESFEDAMHKITLVTNNNEWLDDLAMSVSLVSAHTRQQMLHQLEARARTLRSAIELHREIDNTVRKIIKQRSSSSFSFLLDGLEEDCRAYVYNHLSFKDAVQLMRTCNTFENDKNLHRRLPSPRIRHISISADSNGKDPAPFPHARYGVCQVNSFVSVNSVVRLYVDFVQEQMWPEAQKGYKTWDEMASAAAAPDVKKDDRLPHIAAQEDDTALVRPGVSAKGAKRRKYNNEGPREARDPTYEYKRLDSMMFFDDDLKYSVDLVYADTKLPVERCNIVGGIEFKGVTAKNKGFFSHRDISITRPHSGRHHRDARKGETFGPAYAQFKVIKLSSQAGNRAFCLRLRGQATRFGTPYTLTHFSEPFYAVSKLAQCKDR